MTTKFRPRRVCGVSGLVRVQQLMLVSKTELSPPDPEIPRRTQIWVHPAIPGQSAVMDWVAAAETTDTTLKTTAGLHASIGSVAAWTDDG